jgi:hypothetical protein
MEEKELREMLFKQQDQILTLQIMLQCLIDELIDNGTISESNLDTRLSEKIDVIRTTMDEMKKEKYGNINTMNFGGPVGEA